MRADLCEVIQQCIEVPLFLSHVGTQACTAVHFKGHIEQIPAISYGRLWFNFTDQDACTFFGRVLKPIDMPLAFDDVQVGKACLLYTSPSPQDATLTSKPSTA